MTMFDVTPRAKQLHEQLSRFMDAHIYPNEAAIEADCPDCEVLYSNADQDASKQQQQAEAALALSDPGCVASELPGPARAQLLAEQLANLDAVPAADARAIRDHVLATWRALVADGAADATWQPAVLRFLARIDAA